jgi:hypothetical protein
MVFAVAVTFALWLLTLLGPLIFQLRGSSTNPKLEFFLGLAVPIVQYPSDAAARKFCPNYSDKLLGAYMILSAVICAAILVWENLVRKSSQS